MVDDRCALSGPAAALTLLYDGGCPLCVREVKFLRKRDQSGAICFVDVDSLDYEPALHQNISYQQAMARIHAIRSDGTVIKDVAVFRAAYELIGLGWLYAPTAWPLIGQLVNALYKLWARYRLPMTGRGSLKQACDQRCTPAS